MSNSVSNVERRMFGFRWWQYVPDTSNCIVILQIYNNKDMYIYNFK